jgi:hypothetical protein
MDTVLGVTYNGGGKHLHKDFQSQLLIIPHITPCRFRFPPTTIVIIAADQSNGRSILTYQTNVDKIAQLTSHSMMGVSGPNCDLVSFTEYVTLT